MQQQLTNLPDKLSSKRIAEKTGKAHRNIIRDIKAMLNELSSSQNSNLSTDEYEIIMAKNGMTAEITLNERLSLILATGYSVVLRAAIIDDWAEMKSQQQVYNAEALQLLEHTNRPVQIENAKGANALSYSKGGKEECIEWNRKVALFFTNMTPGQLRDWAKSVGVPAKERTSGKEVIRKFRPEKGAGVSIADFLHANGESDEVALLLAQQAMPVVNKLMQYSKKKELK